MKKRWIIISSILIVLGFLSYFGVKSFFFGPVYSPGDLTTKEQYTHLLAPVQRTDTETHFKLNDGIELFYTRVGKGKPVLIVHGGPGIPYEKPWTGLSRLTEQYQFIYYHQRGAGKSSRPFDRFESENFYENKLRLDAHLGIPAQLADIEQIRRKLKQDKIILLAHSFGGFLATLYATEFPEHVEKLILVAPANVVKLPSETPGLYEVVENLLPEEVLPEYQSYQEELLDYAHIFQKSENELAQLNSRFIRYYDMATGNDFTEQGVKAGGWIQPAVFMSMGIDHDYTAALKQLQAPTLLIHGDQDITGIESVKDYTSTIPGIRVHKIPGGNHFPFYNVPNAFEKALLEFLPIH